MFYILLYISVAILIGSGVVFRLGNQYNKKWLFRIASLFMIIAAGYLQWTLFKNYEFLFLVPLEFLFGFMVTNASTSKKPLASLLVYFVIYMVLSSGLDYLSQNSYYTSKGSLESKIISGEGTLEDPYIIERGNIYSEEFDQKLEDLLKKANIVEKKENQKNGGLLLVNSLDKNKEINIQSIYYKCDMPLYEILGNYNRNPASNPVSTFSYLEGGISKKDSILIRDNAENYNGIMLVNYIIHYEGHYYATTSLRNWDGYESFVDTKDVLFQFDGNTKIYRHYLISSDVYLYDIYGDAHYIQEGGYNYA